MRGFTGSRPAARSPRSSRSLCFHLVGRGVRRHAHGGLEGRPFVERQRELARDQHDRRRELAALPHRFAGTPRDGLAVQSRRRSRGGAPRRARLRPRRASRATRPRPARAGPGRDRRLDVLAAEQRMLHASQGLLMRHGVVRAMLGRSSQAIQSPLKEDSRWGRSSSRRISTGRFSIDQLGERGGSGTVAEALERWMGDRQ